MLIVRDNLLSSEKCGGIIAEYADATMRGDLCQDTAFKDDAIISTVHGIVESAMGVSLITDYAAYTRVLPGGSHGLHADGVKLDGTPNHTPFRIATAMLYLNDGDVDFAGGRLCFPILDRKIVPKAGRLVGFLCDLEHQHEVEAVYGGVRHGLGFWFMT